MSNNAPRSGVHTRQPLSAASVRIARGNPLGAKVLSAHLHGRNVVTGQTAAPVSGNVATPGCEIGRGSYFNGTSYLNLDNTGLFRDITRPVTIAYFSRATSAVAYAGAVRITGETGSNAFVILRSTDTSSPYAYTCGYASVGVLPTFQFAPALAAGVPERTVLTCANGMQSNTATDYVLHLNGTRYAGSAGVAFLNQTASSSYLGWDGADSVTNGIIDEFVIFDGVLTPAEIARYYDNPWQIFERRSPALQALAAPAGGSDATVNGQTLTATASLIAGAVTATSTVNGQTLTATASLIGGAATADVTVAGVTLTATASLTAGAVTGDAAVAGQTLTATASLIAGGASGGGSATVAGQTLTVDASLIVGSSEADSSVAGQVLTATATLLAGSVTGEQNATVNGQTLTVTASLIAGSATGSDPNATVAGVTLTAVASLLAGGASSSTAGTRDTKAIGLYLGVKL